MIWQRRLTNRTEASFPIKGLPERPCTSRWSRSKAEACRTRPEIEGLEARILMFSNHLSGAPNHENITTAALGQILRPDILESIIGGLGSGLHFIDNSTGNLGVDYRDNYLGKFTSGYDPAHHFDASYFSEGASYINGNYNAIIDEVGDADERTTTDPGGVTDLFGRITHAVQDFYAHSNWVNTFGGGALVDDGNDLWNALAPYSIVNGAVLVEGLANPSPANPIGNVVGLITDSNYQSPTNPDFRVTVKFADGSTMPGIVSGTYDSGKNHVPSDVAVEHDDSHRYELQIGPFGNIQVARIKIATGLNKDESDRIGFSNAYSTAIQQTKHEFYRLLHLVLDEDGQATVNKLICDWVLPDQTKAVKEAIGEDTSGMTDPQPVTLDSATPVDIPLGDCVHAGDIIIVHADFQTDDPNEDGEGEPVMLRMSGGTTPDGRQVQGDEYTINTYGQSRDIMLVAQVDNETLTALDVGADGDESVTVSAEDTTNANGGDFNQDQNDQLAGNSSQTNLDASLLASTADVSGGITSSLIRPSAVVGVTITTTAAGTVVAVANPATTDEAASAGFEMLAALDWRESTALNTLTRRQSDTNDGEVPSATAVSFTLSAPGADTGLVTAVNTLSANLGQIIGLADTLHVALDRAANAKSADHAAALIAQGAAAREYATQMAALIAQQPALRAQLQAALIAAGINPSVSSGQARSFEQTVTDSGLPSTITKLLQLSGADSATIGVITTLAIAQDPSVVAGEIASEVGGPNLAASLPKAAAVIQGLASNDLAVSVTPLSQTLAPGSPPAPVPLGEQVAYNVTVTNNSPLAVSGATLRETFDQALTDVTWSAAGIGLAPAPSSGTGNLVSTITLAPGASVTFTVSGTLSAQPPGPLVETATVSVAAGQTDANPADNSASLTFTVTANPLLQPLQVAAIEAQTVKAGGSLSLRPHVVDPNFPAGRIAFSLDPGAPAGARIDPLTGIFTYTPTNGATSVDVTIRATNYGVASLSAATTFHIDVTGGSVSVSAPVVVLNAPGALIIDTAFTDAGSFTSSASGSFFAAVDYGDGTGVQPLALRACNSTR